MLYIMVGSLIIAAVSLAFSAQWYRELYKWARQCQGTRIIVAYKGKVKLNAPLVEWLLWANQLDKDKDANGRVIYTIGGTTVAIVKKPTRLSKLRIRFRRPVKQQPELKEGKWSARDETVRQ